MSDNDIEVGQVMMPRPDGLAFMEEGFLFGHYDSRGGATFIPGTNAKAALEDYAAIFFPDTPAEEVNAFNTALSDLQFNEPVTAMFFGDVPEDGELDIEYGGRFHIARLWHRIREQTLRGQVYPATDWSARPVMVCWTETLPEFKQDGLYEYELRPWDLGEDAYGVIYGTGL